MKKIALVLSIIASAFVLASCANKGTDQTATAMSSDTSTKMTATHAKHHRHHHDYKGEASK